MNADVYQTKQRDTYLFLPQGEPFSALPQAVLDQFGSLQFFSTVQLGANLVGTNLAEIQRNFRTKGYSVHGMKFIKWLEN